jgi:hypothetical protein
MIGSIEQTSHVPIQDTPSRQYYIFDPQSGALSNTRSILFQVENVYAGVPSFDQIQLA